MKVLITGGGSGGHITPALAVAHELKQIRPDVHITYVGQTGDTLGDVPEHDKSIDYVVTVRAGKFRRYHGAGWRQVLDVETLLKNIRDVFWLLAGFWQSFWLLGRLKPDVIFTRGSFVSVPICLAAVPRGIPYITHDSDALPGLANRIIAPWAKVHAVALPKEVYANYPPQKTVTVGVPISHQFHPLTKEETKQSLTQLGLDKAGKVLLVTGGGNGADRLNRAVIDCVPALFDRYPDLWIVHVTGRQLEADVRQRYKRLLSAEDQQRMVVRGFVTNLYQYSGVADVVLSRAGGTSMAEFAAQGKACVIVPNPQLTGGHQPKNAKVLADRKAIRVVNEDVLREDSHALMPALTELFDSPEKAALLAKKLAELAQPNASHLLAMIVLEVADGSALSDDADIE
jgi:UDP-N-acetylglucosamine--N-acetylmuramyl-(pentapeptide) pyrophosphoryl-undecaprenol N-acetylglucosamine transferase